MAARLKEIAARSMVRIVMHQGWLPKTSTQVTELNIASRALDMLAILWSAPDRFTSRAALEWLVALRKQLNRCLLALYLHCVHTAHAHVHLAQTLATGKADNDNGVRQKGE